MADAGHQSEPQVRFDAQLAALAVRQHCVFSLTQATAVGLGARAIQKRARSGRLHRIHRAVYSLAPRELLSRNGRFMAAVLACGPGAVLSHRSAAALHELRATDRHGVDVTVPGRTTRRYAGIDVHRSTTLTAADTTVVDGIPCTTIDRTLLDLAAVVPHRAQERALDQAEVIGRLNVRALQDQLERNPRAAGARRLRAALAQHDAGATATESRLEEHFLVLCRDHGLPAPETQVWLVLADDESAVRVDFLWRAQRLIVETDGRTHHRTGRAFETDRRRDQRLTLAGWRVVRITWRQVKSTPAVTARLIAGLLGAGSG
jgi:predicted transcriptional regulator of viral defense system